MPNPLDARPAGLDGPAHQIGARLAALESRMDRLIAAASSRGITITDQDGVTTFSVDPDTGAVVANGSMTIDGTLSIAAGLIGSSALDSQLKADTTSGQVTSAVATTRTWTTKLTLSLAKPSWATSVILIGVAGCQLQMDGVTMQPQGQIRILLEGQANGAQPMALQDNGWWPATTANALYTAAPGTAATMLVQLSGTGFKADASAFVRGQFVALWMR